MSLRIIGVVQARLGSKRLPCKVEADVGGESVLARLIRFLGTVKGLDDIVMAVPYNDLFLLDIDVSASVLWCRGPEDDVLARFIGAADMAGADAVVRVTGDCPLLDPAAVAELVRAYRARPCDYMAYHPEIRGLQSVEILSRGCLQSLDEMPSDYPDREHAGVSYILRHQEQFAVKWVEPAMSWTPESPQLRYRLCVDTEDDLEVVRAVVAALGDKANDTAEVVLWLSKHPAVAEINAKVVQAS